MKTLLATAAVLIGVSTTGALAQAQQKTLEELDKEAGRIFAREGLRKENFSRVVPSGENRRIGFYYHLTPDCAQVGPFTVRITKAPEHGKVEVVTVNDYPHFGKENVRAKCNSHKIKGQELKYKSEPKYIGDDTVEILVLWDSGFAWEVRYDLSVR
jgi:hypothetical protein